MNYNLCTLNITLWIVCNFILGDLYLASLVHLGLCCTAWQGHNSFCLSMDATSSGGPNRGGLPHRNTYPALRTRIWDVDPGASGSIKKHGYPYRSLIHVMVEVHGGHSQFPIVVQSLIIRKNVSTICSSTLRRCQCTMLLR